MEKATKAATPARWMLWLVLACAFAARGADPEPSGQAALAPARDPAVAKVERFHATLLETMREARKLGVDGRYRKLEPALRSAFDLPAMTRIAVGPPWTGLSPGQQSALIDAFSRMSIATYASRFDGYSGERFEVEPTAEKRGADVVVHSRLVTTSGEPVTLNYLMRTTAGDWKIVDVYLNGTISELATRRSEFGAVLKSGGADALIQDLRARGEGLLRAPRAAG